MQKQSTKVYLCTYYHRTVWYLCSPVTSQDEHQEHNENPDQLSHKSLVAEEYVDDALNGGVFRVVLVPIL